MSLPEIFRVTDVPLRCSMLPPEFAPVPAHEEPRTLSEPCAVPESLRPGSGESAAKAMLDTRLERAAFLVDLWQRDRSGFDLFAGVFVWDDPPLARLLSADAAWRAVRLASRAAVEAFRAKHQPYRNVQL